MAESPSWFPKIRVKPNVLGPVRGVLDSLELHTVCEEALCPNRPECYAKGHVTVLILGPTCTRRCAFCAVSPGIPVPPDPGEPGRVARVATSMGMRHVVVTSVTRDDLPDGGASHYAAVAAALASAPGSPASEALVPDFQANAAALSAVASSAFQVLGHNVETVPRLYPRIRPQGDFDRSLSVLSLLKAAAPSKVVKSGFMLGLGETPEEVRRLLQSLRQAGVDAVTIGQYLRPTPREFPVARYVGAEEFLKLAEEALKMGFRSALTGPYVRSSYRAGEVLVSFDRESDG